MVTNQYYEFTEHNNPLSLGEAKAQLRIELDFTDDDELIASYVDVSKQVCADFINRSIDRRNFIIEANSMENIIFEPNNDNDVVSKIEYYPADSDVLTLLAPENYKVVMGNVTGTWIIKFINKQPISFRDDAVKVTINQGYADGSVPTPIIQAMKLLIGDMYERREDRDIGFNSAANVLLRPYRKW